MANTTKNTTKTTSTKTTTTKATTTENKEIEALKAQIEALKELVAKGSKSEEAASTTDTVEISANKKTKITSLTFGTLTLYAPNRPFLKFTHYGQTLTVSYAQLIDYVNYCREAAERGAFYIHDGGMVEELELAESYKHIIKADIVKGIVDGTIDNFEDVLTNASEETKTTLGDIFTDKIYNGELTDLNKIDRISRALGIDLIKKIDEMKSIEENMKQK